MNPYLKAALERYEQLRTGIEAIQTRAVDAARDLSEDELTEIREKADRARVLAAEIEELKVVEDRDRKVAETGATIRAAMAGQNEGGTMMTAVRLDGRGTSEVDSPHRPAPLCPAPEAMAALHDAVRSGRPIRLTTRGNVLAGTQEQTRAAVTLGEAGLPAATLPRLVSPEPRRLALAAGLRQVTVTGTPDVTYPVFGAGAADIVAEGALKPEYDAITPGTAQPEMISVWTDYTVQTGLTLTDFEVRLQAKLAKLIARREDKLLIATTLATIGIQTYVALAASGEPYADSLLAAAALVTDSDAAAEANLCVINPADVINVFGGSTGAAGESPEAELRLNVRGMLAYLSAGITAGTALVGAWPAAAQFLQGIPPNYAVDPYTGMKNNLVTVRGEEAVNIAVEEPTGFCKVTFDTA